MFRKDFSYLFTSQRMSTYSSHHSLCNALNMFRKDFSYLFTSQRMSTYSSHHSLCNALNAFSKNFFRNDHLYPTQECRLA